MWVARESKDHLWIADWDMKLGWEESVLTMLSNINWSLLERNWRLSLTNVCLLVVYGRIKKGNLMKESWNLNINDRCAFTSVMEGILRLGAGTLKLWCR